MMILWTLTELLTEYQRTMLEDLDMLEPRESPLAAELGDSSSEPE